MSKRKTIALPFLFAALVSCGESRHEPQSSQISAELEAARALTQKGFRLKKEGKNGDALKLFQQARAQLASAPEGPETAMAVASNLDDFGTIYLRTGQYEKAKEHYEKARKILEPHAEEAPRLAMGIDFRLAALEAFQAQKIQCREPLDPKKPNENEALPPYLPDVQEAQDVFGKINSRLQGCRKGEPKVVNVRMVALGDGRIPVAEPMGPIADTEAGSCIKKRILEVSKDYADEMPRFTACFRPFTYPFVVGDEDAWKNREP